MDKKDMLEKKAKARLKKLDGKHEKDTKMLGNKVLKKVKTDKY